MTHHLPTVEEAMESLTGFDEIAIEKHLDIDPYMDGERKPIKLMRALVFVSKRRQGLTDTDAKQAAMDMPLNVLNAQFADDQDDLDPDESETDSGKDDSQPGPPPADVLSSASRLE